MKLKHILLFIVFMAVVLFVLVPYLQFVIQRQNLDSDLAMISLDYSTLGREGYAKRVDQICLKNRLLPGSFDVQIDELDGGKRVSVAIRYTAHFTLLFFFHRTEQVVLRNEFTNLGL